MFRVRSNDSPADRRVAGIPEADLMLSRRAALQRLGLLASSAALAAAVPDRIAHAQAKGERKVALVIGNGAYQALTPLPNPLNDASEVAATLRTLGYDVLHLKNADQQTLTQAIAVFRERLKGAAVGLFYYSGHGFQTVRLDTHQSVNHIVPVDFRFDPKAQSWPTMPLDLVIDALQSEARVGLVFMDACRDDPTIAAQVKQTAAATRGVRLGAGLSSVPGLIKPTSPGRGPAAAGNDPAGILIAYSTDPGNVARDGLADDKLSPFTRALTTHVRTPGLMLSEIMGRVSADVARMTGGAQTPWNTASLTAGTYQFTAKPKPPAPPLTGIGIGAGGITF